MTSFEDCGGEDHPPHPVKRLSPPLVRERAARMLAAAGEPARLAMLELLDDAELCVSDIASAFGESLPAVSQRLKVLRQEGLVRSRREGKHVFYAVADQHVSTLLSNILRHAAEPER